MYKLAIIWADSKSSAKYCYCSCSSCSSCCGFVCQNPVCLCSSKPFSLWRNRRLPKRIKPFHRAGKGFSRGETRDDITMGTVPFVHGAKVKDRNDVYTFITMPAKGRPLAIVSRRSIRPTNPHLHESVGNTISLCAFLVLIGQKLFLQQSADGVLDWTGRFERMLLHKTGRGDTAGYL